VKTLYGTATLDGQFGPEWFWDVNGLWGQNKASQIMHGNINAFNVQQALGPLSGCVGHTSTYNGQGTCVPLDLFGTPGAITSAMLDFVGFDQRQSKQGGADRAIFPASGRCRWRSSWASHGR
jgi:iron complex outermembrane receptor protein